MCGICGIISRQPISDDDVGGIERAKAALFHRGPDGEGDYRAENLFMAMRRLSIIDLEGGWQPLYNEDETLALVANGEVYNFVELRRRLEAKGHLFRTHSDCETVVHLYEEYGLDFVQHLRGMYALALWDAVKQRLVVVRDRVGEKPLYYVQRDGRLFFASELKAILATGWVNFEPDPGALSDYYHYGYVPEPRAAVRDVHKLPAGHMLIIDLKEWNIASRCYWRMEDAPPLDAEPAEVIGSRLNEIAEIITRADVPVGVALSAGLDSSTVAYLAHRGNPGAIHALCVGYPGDHWVDERPGARAFAEHIGMPFHDIELSEQDVVQSFPRNCIDKDDPIADMASHGYDAVARLAREKGIPVLIQGQGADELFWGYAWVRRALAATMRKFGDTGPVAPCLKGPRYYLPRSFERRDIREYVLRCAGILLGWRRIRSGSPDQLHFYDMSKEYQRGEYAVPRIFANSMLEKLAGHDPASLFTIPEPRGELDILITKLICQTYLLENGIAQGDRISMASSIELRLPLVDYQFFEAVIGLRKANPDHHLTPKAWFREAIRHFLPDWVMKRPKMGFTPPTGSWMRALMQQYGPGLEDGFLVSQGILRQDAARKMARRHSSFTPWPLTFYKTLVLEWWCRGMAAMVPGGR